MLKGKDDLAISLNNQIPSLQSVHDSVKVTETSLGKEICSSHDMNVGNNLSWNYKQNVWSSCTTISLMNEKLSEGRVHGWGNGNSTRNITSSKGSDHVWGKVDSTRNWWSSRPVKNSGGWCSPSISKGIMNGNTVNKAKGVPGNIDNQFKFEKPHPVRTNKYDEHRVQSCLTTRRDVSYVQCVPDDTKGKRRVVNLKSDVHCVQSGKMVDCSKTLIDDSSSITFDEENHSSTNDCNHLKRKNTWRDDNRAKATANRNFENYKKARFDNSFIQPYRSNANSSTRTKVAAKVIYNTRGIVHKEIHTTTPTRHLLATERLRIQRGRNKDIKINGLPIIETCIHKIITRKYLQGTNKFFLNIGEKSHKDCNGLEIFDSKKGGIHWINKKSGIFSALLVPRKDSLSDNPKTTIQFKLCGALKKLHRTEKGITRGKSKQGVSTSNAAYCIYGLKTMRGSKGFSRDQLSKVNKEAANTLNKFIKRCQDVLKAWIEYSWLVAIHHAFELGCWKGVDNAMYCGLANSYDYYAASHTDDDMGIAIHQVNVYKNYKHDDEIVQYFCFPEYGFCVALRPGDWLLFNPAVHHCLSQKSKTYSNEIVHVSTCYVKTSHVGGNDNSIPLNSFEENYALFDLGD